MAIKRRRMYARKRKAAPAKRKYTPFKDVGSTLGKTLGGVFGMGDAGKTLGGMAGSMIGKIFGSGEYYQPLNVTSNAMYQDIPSFMSKRTLTGTIISHREFLEDVYTGNTLVGGGTSLNVQRYPINPGQQGTFPWLSLIAQNYTEYIIHGMVFQFKSTSADSSVSTNTALGSVIMATQYDPAAPIFKTKIAMESTQFSQSAKPSINQLHPIECARSERNYNNYFIRTSTGVPTGSSLQACDFANFNIATVGFQAANVNIGELWVTYLIELKTPRIPATIGGSLSQWIGYFEGGISSNTNRFSLARTATIFQNPLNNINLAIQNNSLDFTGLRDGSIYLIEVTWNGASTAVTVPTTWTYTDLSGNTTPTAVNLFNNGTQSVYSLPPATTTTSNCQVFAAFRVTTITPFTTIRAELSGTTLLPTGSGSAVQNMHLRILQIDNVGYD